MESPAATIGYFAAKQGDRLLRRVNAEIARAIKCQGVDEMHDLRVAIRRFTSILTALKRCFPRGESRRIRRGLKRIMILTGDVRDCDMAMHLMTKLALPESGLLGKRFRERRDKAARVLAASLRRWVRRNLPESWRRADKSQGDMKGSDGRFCAMPIGAATGRILSDMVKEHFRHGRDVACHKASARELHRFRIAAKKFRYTLDSLAPSWRTSFPGLPDRLKNMQKLLGDINDAATVQRLISGQKISPEKNARGNEAKTDWKEVLSALKKRQRAKTKKFRKDYTAEFSNSETAREWRESIKRAVG